MAGWWGDLLCFALLCFRVPQFEHRGRFFIVGYFLLALEVCKGRGLDVRDKLHMCETWKRHL